MGGLVFPHYNSASSKAHFMKCHKPMPDEHYLAADSSRQDIYDAGPSLLEKARASKSPFACCEHCNVDFQPLPSQIISFHPRYSQNTSKMLGLRNLARNAPRSAARLSTKAVRPQSSVFRQTAAFQPAWAASVPRLTAAFHVSARRQESGAGKKNHKNRGRALLMKWQSAMSLSQSSRARSPWRRT